MKILLEAIAGYVETKPETRCKNAVMREKVGLALPSKRGHFIQKKTVIT